MSKLNTNALNALQRLRIPNHLMGRNLDPGTMFVTLTHIQGITRKAINDHSPFYVVNVIPDGLKSQCTILLPLVYGDEPGDVNYYVNGIDIVQNDVRVNSPLEDVIVEYLISDTGMDFSNTDNDLYAELNSALNKRSRIRDYFQNQINNLDYSRILSRLALDSKRKAR